MTKVFWTALLAVLVLLIVVAIAGMFFVPAGGRGYGWGMMGPGMMGGYGFSMFGMVIPLLFIVLTVAGLVWLVQGVGRTGPASGPGAPSMETPLDILKRRYAQGEITKQQFEQMKKDLGVG